MALFEDDIKGRKGVIKKGNSKSRSVDKGSRKKQAKALAKGYSQAVVKLYSYRGGARMVKHHASYLTRDGELSAEHCGADGFDNTELNTKEEVEELIEDWALSFDKRKNSRDTANMVLSAPTGTSIFDVKDSARETVKALFPKNEYLMVAHTDTNNPHVHVMLKMRDNEGKKIRINKPELKKLKDVFAENLQEKGVKVESSYRTDRSKFRSPFPQYAKYIKERVGRWSGDKRLKKQVHDLTSQILKDEFEKPDFMKAIEEKHESNVALYSEFLEEAQKSGNKEDEKLFAQAIKKLGTPEIKVMDMAKKVTAELIKSRIETKKPEAGKNDIER